MTSSDGLATLTIPEGALPAGTRMEDLRITRVTDGSVRIERDPEAIVYRFEPDGLRFNTPATLRVRTSLRLPTVPTALHLSGQRTIEVLPMEVSDDSDDGTLVATGAIEHFSEVAFSNVPFWRVTVTGGGVVNVGTSFTLTATIDWTAGPVAVFRHDEIQTFEALHPWTAQGWFGSGDPARSPFGPASISNAPASTSVAAGGPSRLTATGTFRCIQTGSQPIQYSASLDAQHQREGDDDTRRRYWTHVTVNVPVQCVQPNRPPSINPIIAQLEVPRTTYTLLVSEPDGDPVAITWSRPPCGTVEFPERYIMVWTHDAENCDHSQDHQEVTIAAIVTAGADRFQCTYQGAGSGIGPACTRLP